MNSSLIDNIQKYLYSYADLVSDSNSLNLTNKAIHAENLFAEILNIIFDWNLINANEIRKNQDTYDLVDQEKNIYIQVTSDKNHGAKYNKSVDQFISKYGNKVAKNFIILFVTKHIDKKLLHEQKKDNIIYQAYDLKILHEKIHYKCGIEFDKLTAIHSLLERNVYPLIASSKHSVNILQPIIQSEKLIDDGLYIKRDGLIEDLFDFAQKGNGLIVGGPGFGKSFTLEELQRYCNKKQTPCYIIRINELVEGSDKEIGAEFKLDSSWVEIFKNALSTGDNCNGILIFDAFDTAKNELLKSNILKKIRTAIQYLNPHWSVLVSVRTYDACKSTALQDLFKPINYTNPIPCRHFEISELTEYERDNALNSNQVLKTAANKCTSSLKQLLRVPYFLKIFKKIIQDKTFENSSLLDIETEGQLLDTYWNRKISGNTLKENLLRNITNLLVKNVNLSCNKFDVISENNAQIYEELISTGILVEVSISKQKVSFYHNILLDYAISRYMLHEDINEQIEYIKMNEKIPFIFRHGFVIFYSRMWDSSNSLFWKHYYAIAEQNSSIFRLFHQTVLNYVVISLYKSYDDLSPLLERKSEENQDLYIKKILNAVRFVHRELCREHDAELLIKLTEQLHPSFLWELGFIIEKSINYNLETDNQIVLKKLSEASCNYLNYILEERLVSPNKEFIENNGGLRGIENVCKTYQYNRIKSRNLFINKILPLLSEPNYPIIFFTALAEHIVKIFSVDIKAGMMIYEILYFHEESSTEKTYMHGSPIVSLISNRQQDYGLIRHRLESVYDKLLEINFSIIMPIGVKIVNKHKISKYTQQHYGYKYPINVDGYTSYLVPSFIYSDYEDDLKNGELSHCDSIFKYLEKHIQVKEERKEICEYILSLVKEIRTVVLWGELLRFIANHPKELKSLSLKLLVNSSIYLCDETIYYAGEMLKSTWRLLTINQKKKVEKVIVSLEQNNCSETSTEDTDRKIRALLSCIPEQDLTFDKLIDINKNQKPIKNTPLPRISCSISSAAPPLPFEDRMREANFNPDDDYEVLLYKKYEQLNKFNSRFEKKENEPKRKDFEKLIAHASYLFENISFTLPISDYKRPRCDYEISKFLQILSRSREVISDNEWQQITRISLFFINSTDYKKTLYEEGEMKDRLNAFIPDARNSTVLTLINLMYTFNESSIQKLVLELMDDNSRIVRFFALGGLIYLWHNDKDIFWQKIFKRVLSENDGSCLMLLMKNIFYRDIMNINLDKVEDFCVSFIKRMKIQDGESISELWDMYSTLLLNIIIHENSRIAKEIINEHLNINSLCTSLIFNIRKCINPYEQENDYVTYPDKHDDLFGILYSILSFRVRSIQHKSSIEGAADDFKVVDHAISHLFFAISDNKTLKENGSISPQNKKAFYVKIKPLIDCVSGESEKIQSGFMLAHTGYYFRFSSV